MPKYELLQKYDLLQFADVAHAVRLNCYCLIIIITKNNYLPIKEASRTGYISDKI